MAEVTTGNELASYQGNAGLATGGDGASNAVGWKDIDMSPLQTFALYAYKRNLVNFEVQEKDREKVEKAFENPDINVPLDEPFADQLRPKMDEYKKLMATNPNSITDPKSWYRIKELDKELLQSNAKLKTVQVAKDHYKQLAGTEKNENKKKNYLDFVAKLDKYKLGEEIPAFSERFTFDDAHLPSYETGTTTFSRVNGNEVQKVESTLYNAKDGYSKAQQQHIVNPEVNTTGQDLSGTLLTHPDALIDLNKKMGEKYNEQLELNLGLFRDKYADQYKNYLKTNPGVSFDNFIANDSDKQKELTGIRDGLEYLNPNSNNPLFGPLKIVSDGGADNPELNHNYTYDADGNRLSGDNDRVRAIYSAFKVPPGGKAEKVLSSEISKTPAEIAKLNADAKTNRMKGLAYVQGVRDKGKLIAAKVAKMKSDQDKETYMSQIWDRNWANQKGAIAIEKDGGIFSGIPAANSMPIYTIGNKGNVEILRPIGAEPIYDVTDKKGAPVEGKSKITGWKGGNYKIEYVDPKTGESIEKQILADFEEVKKAHPNDKRVNLDEFIRANLKSKNYDYLIRGENGTTDRKLNASAQIRISNPATGKDEPGVYDTENLDDNQSF